MFWGQNTTNQGSRKPNTRTLHRSRVYKVQGTQWEGRRLILSHNPCPRYQNPYHNGNLEILRSIYHAAAILPNFLICLSAFLNLSISLPVCLRGKPGMQKEYASNAGKPSHVPRQKPTCRRRTLGLWNVAALISDGPWLSADCRVWRETCLIRNFGPRKPHADFRGQKVEVLGCFG